MHSNREQNGSAPGASTGTEEPANRPSKLVLLGPQRAEPSVAPALERAGIDGTVSVVTAGWEEREDEDHELGEHVGLPLRNLRLFARAEQVLRSDPALATGFVALRRQRRAARSFYDLRLAHLLAAVRDLSATDRSPDGVNETLRNRAFEDAIDQVRRLDDQHLATLAQLDADYEQSLRPSRRAAVQRHAQEIAQILANSRALCIAGGDVQVLLVHLQLFGVMQASGTLPIFAWSAGAMLMGSRILLFHDNPPWGPGNAEVFDRGFGLLPDAILLPHARQRLRLDDAVRVSSLARRMRPARLWTLDEGASIEASGPSGANGSDHAPELQRVRRLEEDGSVRDEEEAP